MSFSEYYRCGGIKPLKIFWEYLQFIILFISQEYIFFIIIQLSMTLYFLTDLLGL